MTRLQKPPYVVGMPTETVYGLAARIDNEQGLKAIFEIKQRPFFDPLIVHVDSLEQAKSVVHSWPNVAEILAERFWPGPFTMVLKKADHVNPLITSGLDTVAVRMPRHSLALQLIREEGVPLAAPSANRFGRTSPTLAKHVTDEFGDQFQVIDGGPCQVGVESTVLAIRESANGRVQLTILRLGEVNSTEISEALRERGLHDFKWSEAGVKPVAGPGQLKHHYMPEVPLVFVKLSDRSNDEILQDLKKRRHEIPEKSDGVQMRQIPETVKNLQELLLSSDAHLAARQLYNSLRLAAASHPDVLIFREQAYHRFQSWEAIMDRLTKAASIVI